MPALRNLTYQEYNLKTVTTLMSAHIFLTHNFGFSTEARAVQEGGKKASRLDEEASKKLDEELMIDQMEMFALFQKHRASILKYVILRSSPSPAPAGVSSTVFLPALRRLTVGLVDTNRWLGENQKLCDICMEATIHILSSGGTLSKLESQTPPRHWRTLEVLGSVGRFCPDTEMKPQVTMDDHKVGWPGSLPRT